MAAFPNLKAYDGQGAYIFVSYSHRNKEIVYPFIAALQESYNVWFDEGIHYGTEWEEEIAARLEGCSVFLYMISEESLSSANCKDELYHARELEKPFLNVLIRQDIELPKWFRLRYGRYQMCRLFAFSSPESAAADLERKCDWFDAVRKQAEAAEGASGAETEERKDGQTLRSAAKCPILAAPRFSAARS